MSNIGFAWDYDLQLPDDEDRTITLGEYLRLNEIPPPAVICLHRTEYRASA